MRAIDVLARVDELLTDDADESWTAEAKLRWLNDARSAAYILRPDLYGVTSTMTLAAGADQTVPDQSKRLLDVIRNVSHRNKAAITPVDAEILNRVRPNRRSMTPVDEIQHFIYDETDPTTFEVYPPAKAGVQIEVRVALPPAEITNTSEELEEEGPLAPALADFVVARCYQQEVDASAGQAGKAERHLTLFTAQFSGDAAAQSAASPNATREGAKRTQ